MMPRLRTYPTRVLVSALVLGVCFLFIGVALCARSHGG